MADEYSELNYYINKHKTSTERTLMLTGERYFIGEHDILNKTRQAIGNNGELININNLPNNKIVDNQYRKLVNQKVNYILGKPFIVQSQNKNYNTLINQILDKRFFRILNNICYDSLNCGLGWLYVYCNENNELGFEKLEPSEIIPIWKDRAHTVLEYAIRVYKRTEYKDKKENTVEYVEVYNLNGIDTYTRTDDKLKFFEHKDYLQSGDGLGYNWSYIPLIPFKYNSKEIPLIKMVKSLQDGINTIISTFQDNMQEDARNTIMVLVNYGGESLGEFRKNLATYGAVKITTEDGIAGDVRTIQVEVNAENYKSILSLFKKAIIENAMGYDAKDDRMSGNANQLNIQSMYSDIDLDANAMEIEYQASMEQLLWFIYTHLYNTNKGDFESEKVDIIFNRDMLMNETEIINNLNNSISILSKDTLIGQHPWVTDAEVEKKKLKKEQEEDDDPYPEAFPLVGDKTDAEKE